MIVRNESVRTGMKDRRFLRVDDVMLVVFGRDEYLDTLQITRGNQYGPSIVL